VKLTAVPDKPVPIIIGGHAKPALRRAAKIGDGWISANTDFDTLKELIGQPDTLRVEQGTADREDFEIHALDSNCRTMEDCQRLADLGVTDICVTPWSPYKENLNLQDKLDQIQRFSDQVIQAGW
jgi:alkanesulfonate monooxygenase SsuD/methylene tetrahydromethanopterin reductase-like flavin-dependent oxidoreductase (luciferase family)